MRGRELVVASRVRRPDGYIQIKVGVRRYELEHRVVMAAHIGRALETDEHVHHINHGRADNRMENLQLLSASEHQRVHPEFRQRQSHRVTLRCVQCGTEYSEKRYRAASSKCCSNTCRLEWLHNHVRGSRYKKRKR